MKNLNLTLKISKIFLFVIGGLVIMYMALIMSGSLEKHISEDGVKTFTGSVVDYSSHLIILVSAILLLAILIVTIFSLINSFSNVKKLRESFLKIILPSIIVFIFAYTMADDTPIQFVNKTFSGVGETKWTGVGLIIFYVIMSTSILSTFLLGPIIKFIRK